MRELSVMSARIKALCDEKEMKFQPWEYPRPWEINDADETPHPTLRNDLWWPKLVEIRRRLKAELAKQ